MSGIADVAIDDREPEAFVGLFKSAGAEVVTVERLKVGDFVVNKSWMFERKTMVDFCASLVDGRLFRQAIRMLGWDGHVVLILEGGSKECAKSRVSREAIQGALITLSVFFGIPVLRAIDAEETVRLMGYTVLQSERFSRSAILRHGYRPKKLRTRQLFVLQGLPGIGRERAESLLQAFGSVEAVMTAEVEELAEVEGIGEKTARRVREVIAGIIATTKWSQ